MQTYPTGYTESHRMTEKIFREILPRHSMAVREEQIALCHEVLDTFHRAHRTGRHGKLIFHAAELQPRTARVLAAKVFNIFFV